MNDSQKILQKYMKKISQEQLVNYIAVDIAESLKSYPSQTDINRVEKVLKTYFVATNARHTKY